MRNGDLSNELTKRVLVSTDVFISSSVEIKKILGIIPKTEVTYLLDRPVLSRLYLFADRTAYTLELVAFEMSEEDLEKIVEDIDSAGTNPFRYSSAYPSVAHLVADLPYRPEVAGVLDIPTRLLRYGHWGMDQLQL